MSLQPRDSGWSVPAQLAETAVTGGTNHIRLAYFQLVKGLVEYRQGRFDSAISWAQKSLGASGTNYTTAASAGAVLAMAQQQLKQSEEARKALAQATQVFETKLPKPESGDLGENWPEWLVARILVREAKGLIEGPGTPSGKP
jgi:tetratricopeptide (TPR) repeat protein